MKVKIGSLEIVDVSWEELDELVDRYGADIEGSATGEDESPGENRGRRRNGSGATPSDRVVLDRLIAAGNEGVPTQDLGEILGRRGKSIRPALQSWAVRIGLVVDKTIDAFEDTRVGSRRGARIKPSFQPVAKELVSRL